MKPYRCIGIMSGTSADGIDAVLLELDDVYRPHLPKLVGRASMGFSSELSHELVHAQELTLQRLTELHFMLPQLYADTVKMLPEWQSAQTCGLHGQTVTHQVHAPPPAPKGTLQIGVSSVLATLLQMPVVGDLRSVDVGLGGQGAPIVPVAHWFFLSQDPHATLVVNLGGICNITLVTQDLQDVQGYDIGPGMMLSDAYARLNSHGTQSCDADGLLSSKGRVLPELMHELLAHPFLALAPPKSAGREQFGRAYYEPLLNRYHGRCVSADIMRTLIEATALILKSSLHKDFGESLPFARVILTGGGALNPQLRQAMERAFHPITVAVAATGVMAPQNHEPAAMALIASRTMHGLPSALPQVTGARYGHVLGHIFRPTPANLRLHPWRKHKESWQVRLNQLVHGPLKNTAQKMLDDHAATAVSIAVQRGLDGPSIDCALGVAARYIKDEPRNPPRMLPPHEQQPVTTSHVFDVASLTKVAVTTACIMALITDGRLTTHARAATFLPQLRRTNKEQLTIAQLLSHRSGLPAWAPLYLLVRSKTEALQWIAQCPLGHLGSRCYSDLGYILLAAIIERITGETLDEYFEQRIAHPLGLRQTQFGPIAAQQWPCVATAHSNSLERAMLDDPQRNKYFGGANVHQTAERFLWRTKTMQGEVNDGNAHHVFGGVAGHTGLFASAKSINRIAMAMIDQHQTPLGEGPLFAAEVCHQFAQPIDPEGQHYCGWANPAIWRSLAQHHDALAHYGCLLAEGFTGCVVMALPSANLTLTVLTNRQHSDTDGGKPLVQLDPFWNDVAGALLGVL